jgi:hypothetical protein
MRQKRGQQEQTQQEHRRHYHHQQSFKKKTSDVETPWKHGRVESTPLLFPRLPAGFSSLLKACQTPLSAEFEMAEFLRAIT